MENKKLFNKKALFIDLQPFMKSDASDEYFIKSLFFKLLSKKKEETISAAISLSELSLLSYSIKTKLLNLCFAITDSISCIDQQEKLNIRKKLVLGIDNAKKLLFIFFEFYPFSTKISIISDPGPEEQQTSMHVCGLIRETTSVPYSIKIFDHTAYCFGETIHITNEHLYNAIAVEFIRKVIQNKSLHYKLNIELSSVENIRELEINFAIQHLGLRHFEQVETPDKKLLLDFDTDKSYDNP